MRSIRATNPVGLRAPKLLSRSGVVLLLERRYDRSNHTRIARFPTYSQSCRRSAFLSLAARTSKHSSDVRPHSIARMGKIAAKLGDLADYIGVGSNGCGHPNT